MTDKNTDAELAAKVAAMTPEQTTARINEIINSDSPEEHVAEFAKLIFWPDTQIIEDDPC